MKRLVPLAALLLSGCMIVRSESQPQRAFFANLSSLCGRAFEGRVISNDAADADMRRQRLVMHVRECTPDTIRIPFHVGENRSRTWVVSRPPIGLRLKHDHRHEDGSPDRLTQYGGDTSGPGTRTRQLFPADEHSKALFAREGIPQSAANVWAVEVFPGRLFAYELRRPGRFFRVEFDLRRPVPPPPSPWGSR